MIGRLRRFLASESAGGLALALAAVAAFAISNSALAPLYRRAVDFSVDIAFGHGSFVLSLPLLGAINDGLMALFFFVVGLAIKRELLDGELAPPRNALLPAVAALGGMLLPALIYAAFNHADAVALRGWGVPVATDIAFALGALRILGRRVPASLVVFVTAVAIIDDLGAIVVIAAFYTASLSLPMLGGAAAGALALYALNRAGVERIGPYALAGLVVWLLLLKAGVHPTLAGVATAFAVPLRGRQGVSPLQTAEDALNPWVSFGVLPLFAFANAGVDVRGVSPQLLIGGVPLGIACGLVIGKAAGVFGASTLLMRSGVVAGPHGATTRQLFGVSVLCGIGFTMSLFIGALAFAGQAPSFATQVKLGVITGSLVAALLGIALLWRPAR